MSRAIDYVETEKSIDSKRVMTFGFSRLGKAALRAGATDPWFSGVLGNESRAGGGGEQFHRGIGENFARLCFVFPHRYAKSFRKYMGNYREALKHNRTSFHAVRNYYTCLQRAHQIEQLSRLSTKVKALLRVASVTIIKLSGWIRNLLVFLYLDHLYGSGLQTELGGNTNTISISSEPGDP